MQEIESAGSALLGSTWVPAPAPQAPSPPDGAPPDQSHSKPQAPSPRADSRASTAEPEHDESIAILPLALATREAALGLGLAALYGLALGARAGGLSLLTHSIAVPLAIACISGLGVPSLAIALALFDAPIDGQAMASATARATGVAGRVLAGLAPTMALFVVSSETAMAAAFVAAGGLALAGGLGLSTVVRGVSARLDALTDLRGLACRAVLGVFVLFTVILALRLGVAVLPILAGESS